MLYVQLTLWWFALRLCYSSEAVRRSATSPALCLDSFPFRFAYSTILNRYARLWTWSKLGQHRLCAGGVAKARVDRFRASFSLKGFGEAAHDENRPSRVNRRRDSISFEKARQISENMIFECAKTWGRVVV